MKPLLAALLALALLATLHVTPAVSTQTVADTDRDGCSNTQEPTLSPATDPNNQWDFYSVPVPALIAAPNPLAVYRDSVVGAGDGQAVYAYFQHGAQIGTTEYEQDLNLNGVKDGIEYDRSVVSAGVSGPPDGVIGASDAQLAHSQFVHAYSCAAPAHTPVRVITLGFADHPATTAYRDLLCNTWVPELQAWFVREVGLTFDYTCEMFNSQFNISQVQSSANNTPDACGEGLYPYSFQAWVYPELGINNSITPHERDLLLVEAGGGYAGTNETTDSGVSVVGNWQAEWQTTGVNDPCCVTDDIYGIGDCEAVGPRALGHEILNAFGCGFYTDTVLWYNDPLPDYVKAGIRNPCNVNWLYPP